MKCRLTGPRPVYFCSIRLGLTHFIVSVATCKYFFIQDCHQSGYLNLVFTLKEVDDWSDVRPEPVPFHGTALASEIVISKKVSGGISLPYCADWKLEPIQCHWRLVNASIDSMRPHCNDIFVQS